MRGVTIKKNVAQSSSRVPCIIVVHEHTTPRIDVLWSFPFYDGRIFRTDYNIILLHGKIVRNSSRIVKCTHTPTQREIFGLMVLLFSKFLTAIARTHLQHVYLYSYYC